MTLFTKNYGKVGLIAKGVKKAKNSLTATAHVLFRGLCFFNSGHGLGTLYQAESLNGYMAIRSDVTKMAYAALISELTDRLMDDRRAAPTVFDLLTGCLDRIEQGADAAVIASLFSVKMMPFAGIAPQLECCVHCGNKAGPFTFSIAGGGLLCARCTPFDPHAIALKASEVRLLYLLQCVPLSRVGNISVRTATSDLIGRLIDACYEQNAGIQLRARRFLQQLSHFESDQP